MLTKFKIKNLIYIQIIWSIIASFLCNILSFSKVLIYAGDLISILLLFILLRRYGKRIIKKYCGRYLALSLSLFFGFCLLSAIINIVNPFYFIWGARNTLRGLLFFIEIIYLFDTADVNKVWNILYYFQFLNIIMGMYEHYYLGYVQDRVGGMFGYGAGVSLDIYCGILMVYALVNYLDKKLSLWKCAVPYLMSIFFAVIAEEGFIFIEIVIVTFMCFCLTKQSIKKIFFVSLIVIAVSIGFGMMRELFPVAATKLLNINSMLEYSQMTGGGIEIPRIGSFKIITDMFFRGKPMNFLFGLGLGACDYADFGIFRTPFWVQYGYLHYKWFVHQNTFLELGLVGFALFVNVFVSMLITIFRAMKLRCNTECKRMLIISFITIVLCVISIWYNNTLKSDTLYIPFFAMATGFVYMKNNSLQEEDDV